MADEICWWEGPGIITEQPTISIEQLHPRGKGANHLLPVQQQRKWQGQMTLPIFLLFFPSDSHPTTPSCPCLAKTLFPTGTSSRKASLTIQSPSSSPKLMSLWLHPVFLPGAEGHHGGKLALQQNLKKHRKKLKSQQWWSVTIGQRRK